MSSGADVPDHYTTTTRYAEYIETAHQNMITLAAEYRDDIIDSSPFTYTVVDPSDAFFMSGYVISDYPTVYDMYGKFLAGLDVEVLWNQIHSDAAYGAVINEMVSADNDILQDELDEQIADLFVQARSNNAVMTSTFIIAEANMRSKKIYALAKMLAELRIRFSELAQRRWETHLNWNLKVIDTFLKVNELFFSIQTKYLQDKATVDASNLLWPFTVLDHERVIVACLQGAVTSETKGPKGGGGMSNMSNIMGMAAGGMELVASAASLLAL